MTGIQIGPDRPDRLLRQDAFERRHIHRAIAHLAAQHGLQEVLVSLLVDIQLAQVGRDAAADRLETMTAGAVLVVGRSADADGFLVAPIRVFVCQFLAERLEGADVDRLRCDIAVGQGGRCEDDTG